MILSLGRFHIVLVRAAQYIVWALSPRCEDFQQPYRRMCKVKWGKCHAAPFLLHDTKGNLAQFSFSTTNLQEKSIWVRIIYSDLRVQSFQLLSLMPVIDMQPLHAQWAINHNPSWLAYEITKNDRETREKQKKSFVSKSKATSVLWNYSCYWTGDIGGNSCIFWHYNILCITENVIVDV